MLITNIPDKHIWRRNTEGRLRLGPYKLENWGGGGLPDIQSTVLTLNKHSFFLLLLTLQVEKRCPTLMSIVTTFNANFAR